MDGRGFTSQDIPSAKRKTWPPVDIDETDGLMTGHKILTDEGTDCEFLAKPKQ